MPSDTPIPARPDEPIGTGSPDVTGAPPELAGLSAGRLDEFLENPRRALWVLSVPIMFGMSVQALYSMVDMIFVGMVSSEALTALAFNMPLMFLAMGATFGLGSGITAVIAQSVGSRDKRRADRTAEHTVLLGIALTLLYTVIGLAFGRQMLALLGVPVEILPLAWGYFRIVASGFCFMVMAVFFRSLLSGEGEVKVPVMIQLGATLLNVALDPIFIFALDMGVRGAALATIASQSVAAVALAWVLFRREKTYVDFDFRGFAFSREVLIDIFRIGFPASLSFMVMSLGGVAFNRLLVEYTPDAVAAHQVGMRIDHLVVMPLVAISSSLVTLVGMFYGARRFDLLRSTIRYAISRSVLIATGASVFFVLAAPYLVAVFTSSEEIRALGVRYLRTAAWAYPFFPFSMLAGRALQGIGRGTPELILSLLRVLLVAVPLASLFTFVLELPVHFIWVAMVLGSWLSAAVASQWLRLGLNAVERTEAVVAPTGEVAPEIS